MTNVTRARVPDTSGDSARMLRYPAEGAGEGRTLRFALDHRTARARDSIAVTTSMS